MAVATIYVGLRDVERTFQWLNLRARLTTRSSRTSSPIRASTACATTPVSQNSLQASASPSSILRGSGGGNTRRTTFRPK